MQLLLIEDPPQRQIAKLRKDFKEWLVGKEGNEKKVDVQNCIVRRSTTQ